MHRSNRLVRLVVILILGGFAVGVCFVALTPGVETLAAGAKYSGTVGPELRTLEGPTVLYDADGNVLDRLGFLDRSPVLLSDVPKVLKEAVIATEDRTFYTNRGVDVRSTIRAFLSNVDEGGIDQGGSTITQQLIKNRYFKNPKRDLDRKLREAILANRLTNEWSKDRILEEYLNTIYFGQNAYGVNAAAQRVIGKPLADLDVADAALLAGVIKNPSALDPFDYPDAAIARRATVLQSMAQQGLITEAEELFASALPLPVKPNGPLLQPTTLYGTEVKNRLLELKELGADEQAAAQRVFAGGLRVYTAFRKPIADLAQDAVDSTVGKFQPFTAAMAVMDPKTGEVSAIVGGQNAQGLALATMGPANAPGRFVGSTFKPITLATAIENGYSPYDTVSGTAPCFISYEPWKYSKVEFKNAGDGGGGGSDTLYNQTRNSVNCAYLNLYTSVGPPKVLEMGARLGMIRPLNPYLSTAIGDTGHSPLEMATVYSTFANGGVRHDPVFIRRVEDSSGRVLYRAPAGRRVLSPQVANTVTDVLSHVTEGTAPRAKLADRPIAGKTGTRDNSEDAWFGGYTPQLTAVVWMGDPSSSQHGMKNVGQFPSVFGGTYPAIIWQKFMSAALKDRPVIEFTKPDETLWPKPTRVLPAGGRAEIFEELFTTTTSNPIPLETTTSSTSSTSSTTSSTTTTTKPKP